MKNTELNLIPIFVAIYEELSLSKAAVRMQISQPAVSKALARLRDIYDEPLFHRTASGVEPTSFASDIYPAMSASLKNYTSTLSASRDFDHRVSNRVFSIACVSVASYELLPNLMAIIAKIAPNIALEVHPLFTEDYETDLRLQRYDLIINIPPRGRSTLKQEVLHTESLKVVCAKDHPRIGDVISEQEFLNEGHVVVSRWHVRASLLNNEDYPALERRKIVYRAAGVLEMMPVINSSELIGMLPESSVLMFQQLYNLKMMPVPFHLPISDLSMIWHPSRTNESAHRWLRERLKEAAKQAKSV